MVADNHILTCRHKFVQPGDTYIVTDICTFLNGLKYFDIEDHGPEDVLKNI